MATLSKVPLGRVNAKNETSGEGLAGLGCQEVGTAGACPAEGPLAAPPQSLLSGCSPWSTSPHPHPWAGLCNDVSGRAWFPPLVGVNEMWVDAQGKRENEREQLTVWDREMASQKK